VNAAGQRNRRVVAGREQLLLCPAWLMPSRRLAGPSGRLRRNSSANRAPLTRRGARHSQRRRKRACRCVTSARRSGCTAAGSPRSSRVSRSVEVFSTLLLVSLEMTSGDPPSASWSERGCCTATAASSCPPGQRSTTPGWRSSDGRQGGRRQALRREPAHEAGRPDRADRPLTRKPPLRGGFLCG